MKPSVLALALVCSFTVTPALAANSPGKPATSPAPAVRTVIEGKVLEVMNAAGYTYFLVDAREGKVWVAATVLALKVGDRVTVSDGMPMANYHSKTLNRTFAVVYFTGSVAVNGQSTGATSAAASAPVSPVSAKSTGSVDLTNVKRAPDGQTVAEIYASSAKLSGKKIALRGRVVKYNGGIMGKNWLHVRDGSGTDGTNDLTITTAAKAKVGDLVLVTGVLSTNRDFGGGYKYPLIVEDATIVVE